MTYSSGNWNMATNTIPTIDIGQLSGYGEKRLPNKKVAISVHEAHGGYIIEINTNPNTIGELYIVGEDKDLGVEIGKIITHAVLKKNNE